MQFRSAASNGSLGGQNAYYDPGTKTIDALPVFAWYIGYERRWNANLRGSSSQLQLGTNL